MDCLRGMMPTLAYLNMVFVWCAVQQLGFFLADGGPLALGRPALAGIILASNLLLGLLVWLGLYSGNMLVNLNPPNLTLLLLGCLAGRGPAALPARCCPESRRWCRCGGSSGWPDGGP